MFKTLSSDSNIAVSVFTKIREKKDKEKTAEMMLLKIIDSFQLFNNLHCSVLISLSNLNNFNIVSLESVDLIKSNQSHQSDSEYQEDSTTSALFTHISMTEKVSCNTESFEFHISMTNNNNNNND